VKYTVLIGRIFTFIVGRVHGEQFSCRTLGRKRSTNDTGVLLPDRRQAIQGARYRNRVMMMMRGRLGIQSLIVLGSNHSFVAQVPPLRPHQVELARRAWNSLEFTTSSSWSFPQTNVPFNCNSLFVTSIGVDAGLATHE